MRAGEPDYAIGKCAKMICYSDEASARSFCRELKAHGEIVPVWTKLHEKQKILTVGTLLELDEVLEVKGLCRRWRVHVRREKGKLVGLPIKIASRR